MLVYLWLGLGGALGTVARFWINGVISRHFESFPMGTLVINIIGSFLIGFFAAMTAPEGRWLASPTLRIFFMTGICGGFTTFSSFSLQTLELAREGEWFKAALNVAASVALCLGSVWLGYIAAMAFKPTKGF